MVWTASPRIRKGKTPVLADEARALLNAIETSTSSACAIGR
jgi:hypothetical protein